jgi:hypothetical protein
MPFRSSAATRMRAFACALALPTAAFAQAGPAPVLTAGRADDAARPVVDGRVDDTAWSRVPPFSAFIQQEPDAGRPASERTEIRFLLDGRHLQYQDYEMHFMVTQGLRDRKTLRVRHPMPEAKLPGGATNPATQQIDFYIRGPQQNPKNRPNRQVFLHFFGMEVTWR